MTEPTRTTELPSRADVLGFAMRTRRNLELVRIAHGRGDKDAHVVTQAVLSLLGIVVFPYEQFFKEHHVNDRLSTLEQEGWPHWRQSGNVADDLQELLRRIRNATAHSRIGFDSDSDDPEAVVISFSDLGPWRAELSAAETQDFCQRFLAYVEDRLG